MTVAVRHDQPRVSCRRSRRPNDRPERPYIKRNIDATRRAWNLHDVSSKRFDYKTNLDQEALAANSNTIDNARLWDVG